MSHYSIPPLITRRHPGYHYSIPPLTRIHPGYAWIALDLQASAADDTVNHDAQALHLDRVAAAGPAHAHKLALAVVQDHTLGITGQDYVGKEKETAGERRDTGHCGNSKKLVGGYAQRRLRIRAARTLIRESLAHRDDGGRRGASGANAIRESLADRPGRCPVRSRSHHQRQEQTPHLSPDTPLGAAPSSPGADSGRNEPHSRPAMPGFPSSDARGRLNGSLLVVGDDIAFADVDEGAEAGDDEDDAVT